MLCNCLKKFFILEVSVSFCPEHDVLSLVYEEDRWYSLDFEEGTLLVRMRCSCPGLLFLYCAYQDFFLRTHVGKQRLLYHGFGSVTVGAPGLSSFPRPCCNNADLEVLLLGKVSKRLLKPRRIFDFNDYSSMLKLILTVMLWRLNMPCNHLKSIHFNNYKYERQGRADHQLRGVEAIAT